MNRAGASLGTGLPPFQRVRRGDGLQLLVAEDRSVPLVHLLGAMPSGARHDPPGREGLAALAVRLPRSGTLRRSARQIAEESEDLGADLLMGIEWDSGSIALEVLAEDAGRGLDLLADLLWSPAFTEPAVEAAKAEQMASLRRRRWQPASLADLWLTRLVYAGTGFGRLLLGSEAGVQAVRQEDLLDFHRQQYRPEGAALVAVGGLPADELIALLLKVNVPTSSGNGKAGSPSAVPAAPRERRLCLVDLPRASQTEIRLGQAGPPADHPDLPRLQLLCAILARRLQSALRERRGWTYHVRCRLIPRGGSSPFTITAAVDNAAVAGAFQEIDREVERLREEPVSRTEQQEACRRQALGLLRLVQPIHGWADWLKQLVIQDLPDDHAWRVARDLQIATPEDLLGVARRHLDPRRFGRVAAGPAAELYGPLAELGEPIVVGPAAEDFEDPPHEKRG